MKKNELETLKMIKKIICELDSRIKLAVQEITKLEDLARKFFPNAAQKDKEI